MIDSQIISKLLSLKPQNSKIYLVGGAVRDILLQKQSKDFDLVCDFDTRRLARLFADAQGGAFYLLDRQRNTSRVILPSTGNPNAMYDFARLNGENIAEDLRLRDFTINAMALDLEQPSQIIDPLSGAADLKDRRLRACSDSAFSDDPVRVIRAVRYAVDLDLTMIPSTLVELKSAVPLIHRISAERNRDEFLKVLDTGKPDIGLQLMDRLGILEHLGIANGAELVEASQNCGALEKLFMVLEDREVRESSQSLHLASFVLQLGRFKEPLVRYLNRPDPSGRTLRTLDLLAAALIRFPGETFTRSLTRMALSNDESDHIEALFEQRNLLDSWTEIPDARQIYRFFKQAPVDLCLIWIARLMARPAAENTQESWLKALTICEKLIETWAEHPQLISPKPLLNGNDLMLQFDLPPGKRLGQLLEGLVEEQAAGTIKTREQALHWVENHITPRVLL